jgi:hypothetical protein
MTGMHHPHCTPVCHLATSPTRATATGKHAIFQLFTMSETKIRRKYFLLENKYVPLHPLKK